jgi:DNA (cytosine-5)-methyltransferase 1
MAQALGWGDRRDDVVLCPTNLRPNAALRPLHHPAPTMAFGHETPRWVTPDELAAYRARVAAEVAPRVNNQSGNDYDLAWPAYRPAPTIASRGLVTMPGENANRHNPAATKSRNDGIRVTVQEAAILQSFPPEFPWRGPKTRQFLQVGNAVPPGLALHLLRAVAQRKPAATHKWHRWGDTLPLFDLPNNQKERPA